MFHKYKLYKESTLHYNPGVIARFTPLVVLLYTITVFTKPYKKWIKKKDVWKQGWAPMVECLLNYSGLTFTVSLWKAEQAFVMNHKPLNEKAHNLQLQSAANRSHWAVFLRLEEKERGLRHIGLLKIYCQSAIWCILLKTDKTFYCLWRADHCRLRVGGNSRHYFLQD